MFFEGSWGDVCETVFDAADADVACRQLGLGAGTVGSPASAVNMEQEDPEMEDAAVTSVAGVSLTVPGCLGDEATLLECGADANASRFEFRLCGVTLACVGDEEEGVSIICFAGTWADRLMGAELLLYICSPGVRTCSRRSCIRARTCWFVSASHGLWLFIL